MCLSWLPADEKILLFAANRMRKYMQRLQNPAIHSQVRPYYGLIFSKKSSHIWMLADGIRYFGNNIHT